MASESLGGCEVGDNEVGEVLGKGPDALEVTDVDRSVAGAVSLPASEPIHMLVLGEIVDGIDIDTAIP